MKYLFQKLIMPVICATANDIESEKLKKVSIYIGNIIFENY